MWFMSISVWSLVDRALSKKVMLRGYPDSLDFFCFLSYCWQCFVVDFF